MKKLFVTIGFDVEHDVEPFSRTTQGISDGIPLLLDLSEELGIKCTFNVLGSTIEENREILLQIKDEGHEVGCHSFTHEPMDSSVYPHEKIRREIEMGTEAILKGLGVTPLTFRAPYLIGDTFLIKTLEEFGYSVDSTYSIAHHVKPILPYHPSAEDWRKEGELNILELPVLGDPVIGESPLERDYRVLWRTDIEDTKIRIEHLIEEQKKISNVGVVTFCFHPWEFIDLTEMDQETRSDVDILIADVGERAVSNFKELIFWLRNKGAIFSTMREFRALWDEISKRGFG